MHSSTAGSSRRDSRAVSKKHHRHHSYGTDRLGWNRSMSIKRRNQEPTFWSSSVWFLKKAYKLYFAGPCGKTSVLRCRRDIFAVDSCFCVTSEEVVKLFCLFLQVVLCCHCQKNKIYNQRKERKVTSLCRILDILVGGL